MPRVGEVAVLVPAPDLAELRQLAERETIGLCDANHVTSFYRCTNEPCASRRDLLARYETGATG